jgi:hypothetical protein
MLCFSDLKPEDMHLSEFFEHVTFVAGGDDNIFSASPTVVSWFNETTLPAAMAKYGATYTTELKGVAVAPYRLLSEVEFLKRGFRLDEHCGRWLAPLRLNVVLEMCCWTKKGNNRDTITYDNAMNSIRELSLHPKEIFDKWVPVICDKMRKHYPNLEFPLSGHFDYHQEQAKVDKFDAFFC